MKSWLTPIITLVVSFLSCSGCYWLGRQRGERETLSRCTREMNELLQLLLQLKAGLSGTPPSADTPPDGPATSKEQPLPDDEKPDDEVIDLSELLKQMAGFVPLLRYLRENFESPGWAAVVCLAVVRYICEGAPEGSIPPFEQLVQTAMRLEVIKYKSREELAKALGLDPPTKPPKKSDA